MTLIQSQPLTREAYLRAAEEPGVEYVDGQLVEKPLSREIADIEAVIIGLLQVEVRKTRGARVYSQSLGYQCFPQDPKLFRKPDVSVIKNERLAGTDPADTFMHIPPDLAVEVISPNDLAYDVGEKIQEYLGAGFPLIWVVHPNTRTVAIHRGDGSVSVLREQDEISGESALPGFKCKVADFFSAV